MPKYFLHIQDGPTAIDYEGLELLDIADAREKAILCLRKIIAEKVMLGLMTRSECIIVTNAVGKRIDILTFYDALSVFEPILD
jgi:hypothetical protein